MELVFKPLGHQEIERLSKKEQLDYYKKLLDYYKELRKDAAEEPIRKSYVISKKIIHPALVLGMKIKRLIEHKVKIKVLHDSFPEWLKYNFSRILDGSIIKDAGRPIIFNLAHIGKLDIETAGEIIKKNFVLLSGDQENLIGTQSAKFLGLNGVYYFDMNDPEDRKIAGMQAVKILKSGLNMMWCTEGAWNFTENRLYQDTNPGFVWDALEADALIVNIGIDQVGQKLTVKIGKPFDPKKHINYKQDSIKENVYAIKKMVEDDMWGLIWRIFEHKPSALRKDVSRQQFEKYIDERLAEWPGFTREIIKKKAYYNKRITRPEEVKAYFYQYDESPKFLNPLPQQDEEKPKQMVITRSYKPAA